MAANSKGIFQVIKTAFNDWSEDGCSMMAAALAYFTAFSLPPLLILIISAVGLALGGETASQTENQIEQFAASFMGQGASQQVDRSLEQAGTGSTGIWATVLSVVGLLFGATGVMVQLQAALNRAWEVEPDPEQGGLKNFLMKRLLSLAMIGAIAFLLLVSLAVTAVLQNLDQMAGDWLPQGFNQTLWTVVSSLVSFVVVAAFFAIIFKVLPDAKIRWRDVWLGAGVTAVLFVLGKFLLGLYLGNKDFSSTFGQAASLALMLVWVYYSAMILLFGAEFTQAWARRYGREIEPKEGAVRVVERKEHVRSGEPSSEQRTVS